MIAAEATPSRDPGKAALDHPSSGQQAKAFGKELVPVRLGSDGYQQSAFGESRGRAPAA